MKKYASFMLFLWQLPQLLAGLIILAIYRKHSFYTNPHTGFMAMVVERTDDTTWGLSMGCIICVNSKSLEHEDLMRHETGHSVQSMILGPIFLLLVGIPSAFLFFYKKANNKSKEWYHSKYPEKWADKLGGANEYNK